MPVIITWTTKFLPSHLICDSLQRRDEKKCRTEHLWKDQVVKAQWKIEDHGIVKVHSQKKNLDYAD